MLRQRARGAKMGERSIQLGTLTMVLAGTLAVCSAHAQSQPDRAIEQFTCKDVMREPDQNREVAIAFLHGFLLGRSGDSKFNVETLEKQTDAFVNECLDNPQARAEEVMLKLKK
jgi:hypothetical protein